MAADHFLRQNGIITTCLRASPRKTTRTVQLTCECAPGLRVDSDEAGTLLVGLGPHAFDQFELLPVDEGAILLPPLGNIPRSARIQACDMPRIKTTNENGGNVANHQKQIIGRIY